MLRSALTWHGSARRSNEGRLSGLEHAPATIALDMPGRWNIVEHELAVRRFAARLVHVRHSTGLDGGIISSKKACRCPSTAQATAAVQCER